MHRISLTLALIPLLLTGCQTTPVFSGPTADSDGYGDPVALERYGVEHAGVYGQVGPGEGFGPLERRLVAARAGEEAVLESRDRVSRRASLLEGDLTRAREQLQRLEAQNGELRDQLSERDRLLATYIQRLRLAERRPLRASTTAYTPSPRDGHQLGELRARLSRAEAENTQLRERLAVRDRLLAGRFAAHGATRQPTRRAPEPPAAPVELEVTETAGATEVARAGASRYHLRVIALSYSADNHARVQRIVGWLASQGVASDVRPRRSGNHWVIDVGDFDNRRAPEAVKLRDAIRSLRYQGRREFATAYFTKY